MDCVLTAYDLGFEVFGHRDGYALVYLDRIYEDYLENL